jgi:DNA invertase Pin-like site-specific DNA recombinase
MPVAVAYTRLSTDDTNQKSLPRQLHECHEAAVHHGYVITRVFEDNGYSGNLWHRPAFLQMIDVVRSGEIAAIFVADRDRLSRHPADGSRLREEFRTHAVKLYVGHQLIGDSAEDDMLSGMSDLFSAYERRKILDRSKRGKAAAARSGKVLVGPSVPLGFSYTQGTLTINTEESLLIQRIFSLCIDQRMGSWRIAKLLSRERVPTKTDRLPTPPNKNRKIQPPGVWSPALCNASYAIHSIKVSGVMAVASPVNPQTSGHLQTRNARSVVHACVMPPRLLRSQFLPSFRKSDGTLRNMY